MSDEVRRGRGRPRKDGAVVVERTLAERLTHHFGKRVDAVLALPPEDRLAAGVDVLADVLAVGDALAASCLTIRDALGLETPVELPEEDWA